MGNIMDDWFGFDKPKPPKVPSPAQTAQVQQQYNLQTAATQFDYNTRLAQLQQALNAQTAQQQQEYSTQQAQTQQEYLLEQAAKQDEYNRNAFNATLAANRLDQSTPFMNLNYEQTGEDRYGNPLYTARTTYTPEQQALLEQLQQNQSGLGQFGASLVDDLSRNPIYSQGIPDFTDMADPLMQRHLAIMNPYFEQQFNKLDNDLRNQGLTPGTPAYDNAVRAFRQTQSESVGQFANQSIQSVMSQYEQPFNIIRNIMGASSPMAMQNLGLQTPTPVSMGSPTVGAPNVHMPVVGGTQLGAVPVGPTNYGDITRASLESQMRQYESQYKQYADSVNAIGGIMGTVLGAPSGTFFGNAVGGLGSGLAGMLGLNQGTGGVLPLFRA